MKAQLKTSSIWLLLLMAALNQGWAGKSLPDIRQDHDPIERDGATLTSFAPIIKEVRKSVVSIETQQKITVRNTGYFPGSRDPIFERFFGIPNQRDPGDMAPVQSGLGSGVIVSEDGFILTNNHVVDGADTITVELTHTGKKYKAEVVGKDPATDVAVLKIDAQGLPCAVFADSDQIEIGDIVMAIGNPLGVGQTVTMGIVGATSRSVLEDLAINYQSFIQTDAAINRGNSGGALVDAKGRLVGINTAIASPSGGSDGLGFAIPSNLALSVMNNLVQYGKMIRGYLGVLIQDITPELSDYFKMETVRGALISEVIPDSPAEEAGMRDGDVVLSVNGLDVLNKDSFRSRIAQTPPGEKVALKILRSGKESTLYPVLAELNEDSPVDGFGSPIKRQSQGLDREFHQDSALQGLELSEISNDLRQNFGIPGDVSGVVILRVDNSSPLARTRLSAGDVVLSVNQINVKSLRDINNALNTHGKSNVLLKILSAQSRYRATQYIVLKK